jgi:hypothetical protein
MFVIEELAEITLICQDTTFIIEYTIWITNAILEFSIRKPLHENNFFDYKVMYDNVH